MMTKSLFAHALTMFARDHIELFIGQWEAQKSYPCSLHQRAAQDRILNLGHDDLDTMFNDVERAALLVATVTKYGSQGLAMGLGSHLVSLSALHQHNKGRFNEVIKDVLAGDKFISLAITEPQAGSDVGAIETVAQLQGETEQFLISGHKRYICGGMRADYFITLAKYKAHSDHEYSFGLFLVEAVIDQVERQIIPSLGWHCLDVSSVTFNQVPATLIADKHASLDTLRGMLKRERINLAVMANAESAELIQHSVKYSKSRQIHGQPLYKKQSILHRLAEMKTRDTVSRSYTKQCIQALRQETLSDAETCIAKNVAVSSLEYISTQAVQILGARGCEIGSVAERSFRDSKILALGGGTTEVMNNIIGKAVLQND